MSSGSVEVIAQPFSLTINSGVPTASANLSTSAVFTTSAVTSTSAVISTSAVVSTSAVISTSAVVSTSAVISTSAVVSASTASVDWTGVQTKPNTIASATVSASATTMTNGASVSGSVSFTDSKPLNFYNSAATPLNIGTFRGTANYMLMQASANLRVSDVSGTNDPLETFKIYSDSTEFNGDISVSGSGLISGDLQVNGTLGANDIELDHLHYGGATGSYVKMWGASVAIPLSSGSGTFSLSLPSFITTDSVNQAKIHTTVTQIDPNGGYPRLIFGVGRGSSTLTIQALDIFYSASITETALTGASAAVTVIAVYPAP
jgi:hypothetical protein